MILTSAVRSPSSLVGLSSSVVVRFCRVSVNWQVRFSGCSQGSGSRKRFMDWTEATSILSTQLYLACCRMKPADFFLLLLERKVSEALEMNGSSLLQKISSRRFLDSSELLQNR